MRRRNFLFLDLVHDKIQVVVLVEEINFANGVELDPNENFLLFCETGLARVHKQVTVLMMIMVMMSMMDMMMVVPMIVTYHQPDIS